MIMELILKFKTKTLIIILAALIILLSFNLSSFYSLEYTVKIINKVACNIISNKIAVLKHKVLDPQHFRFLKIFKVIFKECSKGHQTRVIIVIHKTEFQQNIRAENILTGCHRIIYPGKLLIITIFIPNTH